jgi:branched-chain amino acid transport system substrate-binding protein
MRNRRNVLPLLLAAAVSGCGSSDGPILIGLAGPFSEQRGASMQLGAELAVAEVNDGGGVRGRPLQLVILDDSASAETAVRVARELYESPGLVAVVGHLTSGTTIAAAPIYNGGSRSVVQLSPSASSPQLSGVGPYTFRVCPSDLVHGARLAEWAWQELGARTAAVLYQNDAYGRGVRTTFQQSFEDLGGAVVSEDPFAAALPTFEPYLRRLAQRGGADVVMIAGTRAGAERIIATLDSLGYSYPVVGGDGLSGIEAADVDATGMLISSAYLPDRVSPRNEVFVAAYQAAFGDVLPDHRGAGAYDAVHLLARVIEEVGPDRRRIQEYLATVGSESAPYQGVTGVIAFDENGDVPDKEVVIGVVRDGRVVTAIRR